MMEMIGDAVIGKTCSHCGRTDTVMGTMFMSVRGRPEVYLLCHANLDGTKSDPDCYHLVTVCKETLGARL